VDGKVAYYCRFHALQQVNTTPAGSAVTMWAFPPQQ
jgi:hypothetical protein